MPRHHQSDRPYQLCKALLPTPQTPAKKRALDSGEASRAIAELLQNLSMKLHTLHTHIGTCILQPKAYAVRLNVWLPCEQCCTTDWAI